VLGIGLSMNGGINNWQRDSRAGGHRPVDFKWMWERGVGKTLPRQGKGDHERILHQLQKARGRKGLVAIEKRG